MNGTGNNRAFFMAGSLAFLLGLLLISPPKTCAQGGKLDSLLRLLPTAKDDTAKVWLLNDLGRLYSLRNVDSAILLQKQAAVLSEKIGFDRGQVLSLHRLATSVGVGGDKNGEEHYMRQALKLALDKGVKDWVGRCYSFFGNRLMQGMVNDSAMIYFDLAEKANTEGGVPYYNWLVYISKAQLYVNQNQPEKAEHYYREALRLTETQQVRMDKGIVLFEMSSWYWISKQWDKYAQIADTYFKFMSQSSMKANNLDAAHGMLYFFDENATPASKIPVLKTILKQHEHLGNQLSLANTYSLLGDFQSEAGDKIAAIDARKNAAKIYADLGQLELSALCLKNVAENYESLRDFASALKFTKQYQNLTDSLKTIASQKNMEELEVKYQTSQMEAEITNQQLVLSEQQNRNRLLLFLAIGAVLAGLAIAFFLREKRRRAELSLRLEQAEAGRLRELDTVKSAFFANISHEFRTPLTLILGPLRELEDGKFRGDAKKYFGIMRRNAMRLLALVNQLLDLSRLESGKLSLNTQPGDLAHSLRAVAGSFQSLADQRLIDFRVEVPDTPIWVKFDADKLEKIVGNLLSNAFKFTPEEGRVELRFTNYDLQMPDERGYPIVNRKSQIVIQDTGIGIPAEHLPHIFERFYQVENTGADLQSGSGIGLALTKELVELHGGSIEVKSVENQGTTFTVAFIFEAAEEVGSPQSSVHSQQSFAEEPAPPQSEIRNPQSAIEKSAASHLPIILIAEDHPDVRSYLVERLSEHYQLLEATNGQAALDMALAQTPDLILTDLMMPVMNGVELTRRLKEDVRTNHIPVVMLTAKGDRDNRIGGIETGAEAYLTKPFDAEELRATLANLLAQRRILQEKFAKQIRLEAPKEAVVSLDEKFLQQVLAAIEDNLDDETFGVEQLASAVAMSRSNLFRKIEALLGKSPVQLIRERRLLKAKHLLENGAGNSTEVAYTTGFQSLSYFAKCYQEMFGETPGQVARRYSKGSIMDGI